MSDLVRRPDGWYEMPAPTDRVIVVWDDYYFMRFARWAPDVDAGGDFRWVTDLPYDDERGGVELPLTPRLWQYAPKLPTDYDGETQFSNAEDIIDIKPGVHPLINAPGTKAGTEESA